MADRGDRKNSEGLPEHRGSTDQLRPDVAPQEHQSRLEELRDAYGRSGGGREYERRMEREDVSRGERRNAEGLPERRGSTDQLRPDYEPQQHRERYDELRDAYGSEGGRREEKRRADLSRDEPRNAEGLPEHRDSTHQLRPDFEPRQHRERYDELRDAYGRPQSAMVTEEQRAATTGRLEREAEFRPGRRRLFRRREQPAESFGDSVSQAVSHLSDGMNQLVKGHLALARVEMARDMRALAKDVALEAGGAPPLMVGYLLVWVGIALAIALAIPGWAAFLICAGANFIIGAGLLLWGRNRMKKDKPDIPETRHELQRDRNWISTLREPPETLRGHLH